MKNVSDEALSTMIANGSASFFIIGKDGGVSISSDGKVVNGERCYTNSIAFYKKLLKEQKKRAEVSAAVIYKRYCIVHNYNDEGTSTLEDYNDEETCRKAFEAIRVNGYHISEHEDDNDVKVTFEKFDKVVLTMDVELLDERGNHKGFEPIAYTAIVMENGKIINGEEELDQILEKLENQNGLPLNVEDIVKILKDSGQFEAAVEDINSWHAECEAGKDGDCPIYDAIQDGKSDEEIVLIAYDIDTELVEKYLPTQSTEGTFDDWWFKTGSGILPLECDDMESHAKKVAMATWEASLAATKTEVNRYEIIDDNNPDNKMGIKIVNAKDGLFIQPDNYFGDTQNAPLKIDYFDGKLSVLVWYPRDIYTQTDPTLVVELKGYSADDEKRFEGEEKAGIF